MLDRQMLREIIPVAAGTFVAMIPMEATPFLIGGSIDGGHLSVEQAGWLGTASVISVAVSAMLSPKLLSRISLRTWTRSCVAAMILGYSGFAFASSFFIYIALACLSGCGGGGLLAAMAVRIAGMTDPDKTYGYVYSMASVIFAGLLFLLPQIKAGLGPAAMFIFIATVAAAMVFPLARLPQHVSTNSGEETQAPPTRLSFVIILILVMTISLPLYGGTYGFCERKAMEVGLSPAGVGGALGGAMLMSIIGSLSVAIIGTRPGRTLPTMVVMAIAGIAYLLVLGAHTPEVFIIGFMMFGFMQLALNSYLFGLASALDRSGHVAAALQGFSLVPYGLGAGLFGTLTQGHSLAHLAWPSLMVEVLAMAILLPVLVTLDRAKVRRCAS